ncbi:acetate--CoA ligase family protein, partial [Thermobifida halotolerans]|uniref:acetate--CoA ligase family protein n=1 Tax=Thermobifida halotolerans TaxID=483545 RepID=UPI001F3F13B2
MALDLKPLINPDSVAIIGASPNQAGHAGRCLANLERTGFSGRIYPVNPKYDRIGDHPCHPSARDLPEQVDAAYLLVPARAVESALEDCLDRGVRTVTICSAGYAELGEEGAERQRRLVERARERGVRLLGPNCIGVLNPVDSYVGCPTFNITYSHTPGSIALLSQSGGMAAALFNRAQGRSIGIRAMVSLGNEADIRMGELLDAFVADPRTEVIALYVEQLRDAEHFAAAAERARAAGKPIVLLKVGGSEAGRRTVLGHTGAMAGEQAVFSDMMRHLGVVEVATVDELLNTAYALSRLPLPTGPRLGALSPSGGECGYVADRASAHGLRMPLPTPDTLDALTEKLKLALPGNPLDTTGQVIGDGALLSEVMRIFTGDPNLDMVVMGIPTWGPYDSEALLPRIVEAVKACGKPAVISAWTARDLTERAEELLRESGVCWFTGSDDAVAALANLWRHAELARVPAAERPDPVALPRPAADALNEHAAKRLLAEGGVPVAAETLAADADAALRAAREIDGPLVVKLVAAGITHKSELGLVRLLDTVEEAEVAIAELVRTAEEENLDVEGYLVAERLSGTEIILGAVRDGTFGPVLMVGAGGILAEHFADRVFLPCPAAPEQVRAAVERLAGHPL